MEKELFKIKRKEISHSTPLVFIACVSQLGKLVFDTQNYRSSPKITKSATKIRTYCNRLDYGDIRSAALGVRKWRRVRIRALIFKTQLKTQGLRKVKYQCSVFFVYDSITILLFGGKGCTAIFLIRLSKKRYQEFLQKALALTIFFNIQNKTSKLCQTLLKYGKMR